MLKAKEWKIIYHAYINSNKDEMAILIFDEVDFSPRVLLGLGNSIS